MQNIVAVSLSLVKSFLGLCIVVTAQEPTVGGAGVLCILAGPLYYAMLKGR